ncbi:phage-related tail fiber protein [Ewingella americana]
MTAKYFALLTNQGAAKLANATALGTQLSLTQMAVGDGGGVLPTPDPAQTKLIGEKRRASLNSLSVDPANTNQIIAEQIIPEDQGGFWIREIGLFDQDNTLIAIANCPETYKPQLQEGSGRTQTVRMIIVVSSTDAVTLKIDPSVVLATRKYVDDKVIEVKAYTDDQLAKHVAAANPHNQYLQISKSLAEIKALGPDAVSAVLSNLGLTEHLIPVGVPLPWPTATPPAGWLKCNGVAFDKAKYPQLATAYPSGVLPDLRGEFIRGWDDERGVDIGRALYSAQKATSFRTAALDYFGSDETTTGGTVGTAFASPDSVTFEQPAEARSPANTTLINIMADNSIKAEQLPVGLTTQHSIWVSMRPRSIAFNYIVRAA